MTLALFDLDDTLLKGDSDYLWGRFLIDEKQIDEEAYERTNQKFYARYIKGTLKIHDYLEFQLQYLAGKDRDILRHWHAKFMAAKVIPKIPQKSLDLLKKHQDQGHYIVIITATNRFVTAPIADVLKADHLIATELAVDEEGRYTGQPKGIPSFREGKVTRLKAWLEETNYDMKDSWFYSDSYNDLPLLEWVDHPVAVNPDDRLLAHAKKAGWPVMEIK
ncbi:HAD family hydrolase [Magnetococcales bacterium HHB-1]